MLRHSYGTSVPHVNRIGVERLPVPSLSAALVRDVVEAIALREQADAAEEQAIAEVDAWLG
jgi:hypothetical protein